MQNIEEYENDFIKGSTQKIFSDLKKHKTLY